MDKNKFILHKIIFDMRYFSGLEHESAVDMLGEVKKLHDELQLILGHVDEIYRSAALVRGSISYPKTMERVLNARLSYIEEEEIRANKVLAKLNKKLGTFITNVRAMHTLNKWLTLHRRREEFSR